MLTQMISDKQKAKLIVTEAEKRHEHARRCKKPLDECLVCQGNIEWFGQLPAGILAVILEEKYQA